MPPKQTTGSAFTGEKVRRVSVELKENGALIEIEIDRSLIRRFCELLPGWLDELSGGTKNVSVPATDAAIIKPEQANVLLNLYSKAKITNNNELAAFIIYFVEQNTKQKPEINLIRHLIKSVLNKTAVGNSLTTYLRRAKDAGWLVREDKLWRLTEPGKSHIESLLDI